MNKLILIIATLGMSVAITSCKKEDVKCKKQATTTQNIQGKWKHEHRVHEPSTSQPDNYLNIEFSNDSFKLAVEHYSDIMRVDGCHELTWQEYAKGTFKIENEMLYFSGVYCEIDYSVKTEGCYNIGAFNDTFQVSFCNDTLKMYALAQKKQYYPEIYRIVDLIKK